MMPLPYASLLLTLLTLSAPCHAFLSGSSGAVAAVRLARRLIFSDAKKFPPIPQLFASKSYDSDETDDENLCVSSRRTFVQLLAGSVSSGPFVSLYRSSRVNAMGLVYFPAPNLMNKYHLMRAGQSGLEELNVLSTNPLFLTNTEDGLTSLGLMQVEEACSQLIANNINPSIVKYSLAAKCIDTANTIANTLMVGRNRIVPEFTFMDPRGAGYWNEKALSTTEAAFFALDAAEAGVDGRGGRPPPNEDGTANETLWDQVIRLRQLLSVLETQYSGDEILLIFPDGTSPALLSCLIAGIPLKDVHAFNFEPGEVRIDVTMKSTLQSYAARKTAPQYTRTLEIGKEQLTILRKEQTMLARAQEAPRTLLVPSKAPVSPPRQEVVNDEQKEQSGVEDSIAKRKQAALKRRQTYVNDSFKRSQEAFVNDDTVDYPKFSDYMPVASLGAIASLAMWRPPREEGETPTREAIAREASPVASLAYANSTGPTMMTPMVKTSVLEDKPGQATQNSLSLASPTINEEISALSTEVGSNVFENKPVLSREERINAANQAMEEYLERDDGGDDWLLSLKNILDE